LLDQVVVVDKEIPEVLMEQVPVVLLDQVVEEEHKMPLQVHPVVVAAVDLVVLDRLLILLEIQFKVLLVVPVLL
tara:strand:- start:240 stop:461 length:222 start_codon:yes stop_codon:yes gene_type:complete